MASEEQDGQISTADDLILPPPSTLLGLPVLSEGKRRKLLAQYSSPRFLPASPAFSIASDPDIAEWWSPKHLDEGTAIIRFAVQEMLRYLADWESSDKDPFWHRKSGKPVLSILVRKYEGGKFLAYRGMNTEVSLPAGSFCAERAAITRAATDFCPASEIAVIATLDPSDNLNPLWPCEVCQSWLAKLRIQNPDISVVAFSSKKCENFVIRVNGELLPPPQDLPAIPSDSPWPDLVELVEGTADYPWETREVVYVDGAWNFLHAGHQHVLREARARGSHLLVGIHSDQTLEEVFGSHCPETFETRLGRLVQNRYVSFVLKDAPWVVTRDLITSLRIQKVVTGSVNKLQDGGKVEGPDPYAIAKELGILEVICSSNETTERSVYKDHVARATDC